MITCTSKVVHETIFNKLATFPCIHRAECYNSLNMYSLSECRILALGYKKQLTGDKLWDLRPQDVTRVLVDIFYRKWIKTGKDK